jgi:hypothetical protein
VKVELLATRGVDYAWCSSLAYLNRWIVLEDRNESQSYQLSARERGVVLVRMYFIYTPAYWKTQGAPVQKYTTVGRLKQLTERRQAMTDVRGPVNGSMQEAPHYRLHTCH